MIKKCPFCQGKEYNKSLVHYDMPLDDFINAFLSGDISIYKNRLVLDVDSYDEGGFAKGIQIKYCPMCGRKLVVNDD